MAHAVRVTSSRKLSRPYSRGFVDIHESYNLNYSGFDKTYDIQITLSDGWPKLICSVAWSEDRKLVAGTR